jgi:uncharacterized SAM-binding protein YcdF (DUF218 family)
MDTVVFIISKVFGLLIRPDAWIVVLAVTALLAQLRRRDGLARVCLWSVCVFTITVGVLPIGQTLLSAFEGQHAPYGAQVPVAGFVILGGGEDVSASRAWGTPSLGAGAERLTAAVALSRKFPKAHVIYVGGSGRMRDALGADATEADVARQFFRDQGLSDALLHFDATSRNTVENARQARQLALTLPRSQGEWLLVTSAFHMPRALRSFSAAGWGDITPYPVDYRTGFFGDGVGWNLSGNLDALQTAIREAVGSAAYWALGR